MNTISAPLLYVNIDSGNGLVPSGNTQKIYVN